MAEALLLSRSCTLLSFRSQETRRNFQQTQKTFHDEDRAHAGPTRGFGCRCTECFNANVANVRTYAKVVAHLSMSHLVLSAHHFGCSNLRLLHADS
jgi:hypothetical protein